jgi:hypothetical protein
MKKVLVSLGCSFAWGDGLLNKQHRYSNIIADRFQFELINYGVSGASNEHIASLGVIGINKALQVYKPEDVVVIVGWTSQARLEYWDISKSCIRAAYPQQSIHPDLRLPPSQELAFRNHQKISQFVENNMWCPAFGYYKLMHAFNYLNTYSESKSIDIINIANISLFKIKLPPTPTRNPHISSSSFTANILNTKHQTIFDRLLNRGTSFADLIDTDPERYRVSDMDSHPNSEAHSVWAESIINENKDILGT